MSESISIDFGPVIRAINSVNSNIGIVNNNINSVSNRVEVVRRETMQELIFLKKKLHQMDVDQKNSAALQRALTEIIRVRQELEQNFGTQKKVREHMLGILQATDLGLITESTISRCTEELMISAPEYWLAPCLIALAAWISNNQSLAERALKEACKRDREKTCLLFALITRRVNAGRKNPTNVSFKWLGEYFKLQNPKRMTSSIIAYIDAYTNGVFGEDKENICSDHIAHWMKVLEKDNTNFVEQQKAYWRNVFGAYCDTAYSSKYSALHRLCAQYPQMENYLVRIDASERDTGIKSFINSVMTSYVDTEELVKAIDDQLMKLVSNYEAAEESLRDEERYLEYVKEFKGDEKRAERIMNAIKERRYDAPIDFAKRLAQSITDNTTGVSAKKTAFRLLAPFISQAFNEFMVENKDAYPTEIDLKITDSAKLLGSSKPVVWEGKTENGENRDELVASLKQKFETEKKARVATVTDEKAEKTKKLGLILTCTVVFCVIPVGPIMFFKGKKQLKQNEADRATIRNYYDKASKESAALLNRALDERAQANELVSNFLAADGSEKINL